MTDEDRTALRPGDFTGQWRPDLLKWMLTMAGPLYRGYFRTEVRDVKRVPPGGVLIVSNHSGGLLAQDVPVFWLGFFEEFGFERPVYTLMHDLLLQGPVVPLFTRMGMLRANRDNAVRALRSGAVVIVFPGGDYDALRPTAQQNVIDFNGRTGYVTTALEAGVPIVPMVSIGGQETQLFLTRGQWLARRVGLKRLTRAEEVAVSVGVPFGLSVGAVNLPLPSKIVTQVLEPIDLAAEFGVDPDVAAVDEHVRTTMQAALDELAARRRFPILG